MRTSVCRGIQLVIARSAKHDVAISIFHHVTARLRSLLRAVPRGERRGSLEFAARPLAARNRFAPRNDKTLFPRQERIKVLAMLLFLCVATNAHAYERIVSLKPNITEILFALGAGDRVVGVTTYCDYPDAAKALPRVADYIKPFAERLVVAAPDLIIGSRENTSKKAIWQIEQMGYPVKLFPFTSVDETIHSITSIAALVDAKDKGGKLVREIRHAMKTAANKKGAAKPRVLVVWGQRPLVVTGPGSFMDELITAVGAVNVAQRGSMKYPHWNTENVIAANPDVIVDMSRSMYSRQGMGSEKVNLDSWRELTIVSAVKNNRVVTLDDSLFRAGPRLPEAVKELARAVYEKESPSFVRRGQGR